MIAPTSSRKLTIITHEFFPMKGGIATFVEEMARGCHDLGMPVEVWAPRGSTPFDQCFPYPIHRVPLRGTQNLGCQFRMGREIFRNRERLRDGILYLPEPGPILAMMHLNLLRAFQPAQLLVTLHGSEVLRFAARPPLRLMILRLLRTANRITTPSNYTRELVVRHFPDLAAKTIVTPGAPRAGFFSRPSPILRTDDKVVILSVGRLHPRKGQIKVIEALDLLPPEVAKRAEYWIVGRSVRGSYEAELRRRSRTCQVPVSFFGNIDHDDLEMIYGRADIFAMTSITHGRSVEGFGLAYLEASAFGLPVVGHAIGGVPEAVRHGETGLLVPPGDTAALAGALQQLISDANLRRQFGAAGHRWARSHSWRRSARLLLEGIVDLPDQGIRNGNAAAHRPPSTLRSA